MGRPKKVVDYCKFCQEDGANHPGTRGFVHLANLEFTEKETESGTISYQAGVDFERRLLVVGKYLDPSAEVLNSVEKYYMDIQNEFEDFYPQIERTMNIYYCPICGRKLDKHI